MPTHVVRISLLLQDTPVGRRGEFILDDGQDDVLVGHRVPRAQVLALDPSTVRQVTPRRYRPPAKRAKAKGTGAARRAKR